MSTSPTDPARFQRKVWDKVFPSFGHACVRVSGRHRLGTQNTYKMESFDTSLSSITVPFALRLYTVMPAVPSGKILVTGANGFIASWILKALLEQGYIVRAALRSEEKGVALKQTFKEYSANIEISIVGDISKVLKFVIELVD